MARALFLLFSLTGALLGAGRATAQTVFNQDLAVTDVYSLDQLAQADAAPHTVRARILNRGRQAVSNAVVRLRVSGANPLSRTAVVSLIPGRATVVSFGAYLPGQRGRQRLSVQVPADDNPANDSLVVAQVISTDTTSYITPTEPVYIIPGAIVFQLESALANRFSVGNTPRLIRSVRAYIKDTVTVGLAVIGFVADPATGRVLGRSTRRVLQRSDIDRIMNFDLAEDLVLQNRDYLAGFSVLGRTGAPVRNEALPYGCQFVPYYPPMSQYTLWPLAWMSVGDTPPLLPSDASLANPAPPAPSGNLIGKLMVEVITAAPPACARPANLAVTVRGGPFRVEFDSAYRATGYELAYGPTGFDPDRATATGGLVVAQQRGPFFVPATLPGTTYAFYVRSVCGGATGRSAWAGPVTALAPCTNSGIFQFPYREGFDALPPGQPLPCGVEVLDADNNRTSWRVESLLTQTAHPTPLWQSPPNALYLDLWETERPAGGMADDWFFTPPLALSAGRRYRLSFSYQNLSVPSFPINDRLAVWLGDAPDPARQTTLLYRNPQISNTPYLLANAAATPAVQAVTVPVDGLYHLGFQAYSQQLAMYAAGNGYRLLLDDIELADDGPLAASGAAAVPGLALYPNPAADGRFTLEVPVAATVRIADALGRTVYAGPAAAGRPLALDLSQRPAGMYVLRVCTPAGCETRKLVLGPGQ